MGGKTSQENRIRFGEEMRKNKLRFKLKPIEKIGIFAVKTFFRRHYNYFMKNLCFNPQSKIRGLLYWLIRGGIAPKIN